MANYLHHLTARVTSAERAVRPRVPSLFEPPRALVGTRVASMFSAVRAQRDHEDTATTQESAPATLEPASAPPPAITHPRGARAPATLDATHPQLSTEAPALTTPPRVPALHPRTRAIRPFESEPRQETSGQDPAPSAPQSAPQLRPLPRLQREDGLRPAPGAEATPAATRGMVSPDSVSVQSPVSTPRESAQRLDPPRPAPVLRVETVHHAPSAPPVDGYRPALAPALPLAPQWIAARPQPAEEAPPPVEIVIGRVIVQAIAPPAPAPAIPRAHVPRLSLDDYLRQRGGRA